MPVQLFPQVTLRKEAGKISRLTTLLRQTSFPLTQCEMLLTLGLV